MCRRHVFEFLYCTSTSVHHHVPAHARTCIHITWGLLGPASYQARRQTREQEPFALQSARRQQGGRRGATQLATLAAGRQAKQGRPATAGRVVFSLALVAIQTPELDVKAVSITPQIKLTHLQLPLSLYKAPAIVPLGVSDPAILA